MTYTGTLKRLDVGTGVWVLETGRHQINLDGRIPKELEGKSVVIEGTTADDMMGLGMFGPTVVKVATIRPK